MRTIRFRSRKSVKYVGAALFGALTLVVAGAASPADDARNGTLATLDDYAPLNLLDVPFAVRAGCGTCSEGCNFGGFPGHIADENPTGSQVKGGGWHPCAAGSDCDALHPFSCVCFCANDEDPEGCYEQCQQFPSGEEEEAPSQSAFALAGELEAMWNALRAGTVDPLELTDRYRNVEFNEERQAIQVFGCDRATVVAHIPVVAYVGNSATAGPDARAHREGAASR